MPTTFTPPPAISCFALPVAEFLRRTDEAEDQEEQLREQYKQPSGGYGREILWHPAFAAEFCAIISKTPLYEVAVFLGTHPFWREEAIGRYDYDFLADVLREGLAGNPTPLAALRLNRALAWVEQAGTALLPSEQALPMVAHTTPAAEALAA